MSTRPNLWQSICFDSRDALSPHRTSGLASQRIESFLQILWRDFISGIYNYLLDVEQVLFMPQGALNLLPIHAASNGKQYLIDTHEISYIPSLSSLDATNRQLAQQSTESAQAIEAIGQIIRKQTFRNRAELVNAIEKQSAENHYLHLSCKGLFSWDETMYNPAFYLPNNAELGLLEIFDKLELQTTRLVTLSACEMDKVSVQNMFDEFISLPSVFMGAGVASVLSNLWVTPDFPTELLMSSFYKYHFGEGYPPSKALRRAQLRIRHDPQYNDPFYWAAFAFYGI